MEKVYVIYDFMCDIYYSATDSDITHHSWTDNFKLASKFDLKTIAENILNALYVDEDSAIEIKEVYIKSHGDLLQKVQNEIKTEYNL